MQRPKNEPGVSNLPAVTGRSHVETQDQSTHETAGARDLPLPDFPFVSVVLPIRNEVRYIEECVLRLLDQDYPRDRLEILVIDGNSDDGTRVVLEKLLAQHGEARLRVLDNPARTVPTGLNSGIRAARGEVIVRIDGHTVPARNYISASVASLMRSGATNVGGIVDPIGDSPFGKAVALATKHPLGVGDAKFRTGGTAGDVDTVPFGAFRREVFERVGLFDESLVRNQDYEMNIRIRKSGGRVHLDPSIAFTYTPRGSITSLWRQYFQYGWWRVETARRHPTSFKWRQIIPPSFVAALLVLALIAPFGALAPLPFVALTTIYLSTVLVIAARVAKDHTSPILVALAFMTIHIAWGSGFLLNVVSFGNFPYRAGRPRVPVLQASAPVTELESSG